MHPTPALTLIAATFLSSLSVNALPLLTLTERTGQYIDWSWSDGSGFGTFVSTSSDEWKDLDFTLPSAIAEEFYGQWEEDNSLNHRNHVYIKPKRDTTGALIPNVGVFNANSDWLHTSGGLTPLGVALTSYSAGYYQVVFFDGPDHVAHVPDAASTGWLMLSSVGLVAACRRRVGAEA
jgi:hypothetical protein